MENAWRSRYVNVVKENSKTNVLLNNHHNLSLQKNLSVLHSLTVLSRVRGGAPSWRGADVVRLQPSSVAFERTITFIVLVYARKRASEGEKTLPNINRWSIKKTPQRAFKSLIQCL